MKYNPLISVVMATYNGERYLEEQLESIFNQTYQNLEVIVCDDLSSDNTQQILEKYASHFRLCYTINKERQGAAQNFARAITQATGDYIALADQDDVWLPTKLEISLHKLQQLEASNGKDKPALVFSDLRVVDEKLAAISPSYWQFMQLVPTNHQLNKVLVENVATGCTMLLNKVTANLALPIPPEALMHDVWILLTATCFGKVAYLEEPTVLYRQHSNNVIGARSKSVVQKLKSGYIKLKQQNAGLLQPEIDQAKAFYTRYQKLVSNRPKAEETLTAFISLKEKDFIYRKVLILKYGFYGSTFRKALNVLLRA
ncbi:glycosyltransferase family 2 protein [Botryobacter ruber]|uniref:glycosyltransferase family 2 protein n=1 Tax=Botryobacter ruber TaxID=2171629 RepID=UPI000E0A3DA5|nr:glycosyltransferase family 2 protein [Botryobacter ruber]